MTLKTPNEWATGYDWKKLPNDLRVDLLRYGREIDALRLALRDIVRVSDKIADAPLTAERWADRIEEIAINALGAKDKREGVNDGG